MNRPDQFKLELISGLIDGEVTDGERREADELLSSPELRQLRDDLEENRKRLQSLPQVKAPADLASRIMAAVEQVEIEPAPLPPEQATGQDERATSQTAPTPARKVNQSAGWLQKAVAFAAVAAALLLSASLIWRSQLEDESGAGVPIVVVPKDPPKELVVDTPPELQDQGPTFLPQELQVGGQIHYLLLFEFQVTERALRNQVFEEVLSQNGILLDQTIELDRSMEQALEASRVLGQDGNVTPQPAKSVRMVLVDATLESLSAVIEGFSAQGDDVLGKPRIDLSLDSGDVDFMRQLSDKQAKVATTPKEKSGAAFPVNIAGVKLAIRAAASPQNAVVSTISFEDAKKLQFREKGSKRRMPVLFLLRAVKP